MLGSNNPITPEPSRPEAPQPPKPKKPITPPRTDTFRKTLKSSEAPPSKEEAEQAGIEEKESESPSLFDLQKKGKSKGKSSLEKKPGSKGEHAPLDRRPLPADISEDKTPIFLTPKTTEGEEELTTFKEEEGEEGIEEESEFLQPKRNVGEGLKPKEKGGQGLKPREKETQALPSKQDKGLPELPELPILEPMYSPANKEGIPKKPFAPAEEAPPEQMQKPNAEPAVPREVIVQQQMVAQQQMGAEIKSKGTKESSSTEKKESSDVSKKEKSKGETRTQGEGELGKGAAMGGVNPSIQGAGFFSDSAEKTEEAKRSSTIKAIVSQIVEKIQVMRKDNQTTTIITLKHPPILEGVTITLTASDQAKREFNITFANLSPKAKAFLDRKLKEDSLLDSLERKGIIVHQLTTTTESSKTIASYEGQSSRNQQEKEQQRQQQQPFEEEDEGEGVT